MLFVENFVKIGQNLLTTSTNCLHLTSIFCAWPVKYQTWKEDCKRPSTILQGILNATVNWVLTNVLSGMEFTPHYRSSSRAFHTYLMNMEERVIWSACWSQVLNTARARMDPQREAKGKAELKPRAEHQRRPRNKVHFAHVVNRNQLKID